MSSSALRTTDSPQETQFPNLNVVCLAGGVGGAKLAHGLARVLPAAQLTIIGNTGDDFRHCGLTICPDLDTVMYTLAGVANAETGWGRGGESWTAFTEMGRLGGADWFRLGDLDLAAHLTRAHLLEQGKTLTAATAHLCAHLGVLPPLLPMSDAPAPTQVATDEGVLAFQEWFVHRRWQPRVRQVVLPEDVKARVVWRPDYWLTGEAVSTYVRSAGLFGNEMHSPIMCIGNGVPAIVCRWAEQTSKGFMWRDIGLGDWLFNFDRDEEIRRLIPTLLAMLSDPVQARAKVEQARAFVSRPDLTTIARQGPATPDHVLRTKRLPLVGHDVDAYVADYTAQFEAYAARHSEDLVMVDPAPRVILDPALGFCTVGRTVKDAAIAEDIYRHTMEIIARARFID